MSMISTGFGTLAVTAAMALTSMVPAAQAQTVTFSVGQRDRVVQTYCQQYPRDRDCRGYYGGSWRDRDYDNFYSSRRTELDSIASGFFGFTFGAIVGSALANSQNSNRDVVISGGSDDHVEACYARYRSYDERTDTFLGFDGIRKRCNL